MIFAAASAVALLSTTVLANEITVKSLPDSGTVTLNGVVEDVKNEREFILRDPSGTINVELDNTESAILEKGSQVTVNGTVTKGLLSTEIDAAHVTVHKGMGATLSDAAKSIPGVSTTTASAYDIGKLPDAGAAKITGIVTEVNGDDAFTVKDDTGTIDVEVKSNQKTALTVGAKVTVIGTIDKDLLDKDLNATDVIVLSDAKASSK